MKHFHKISPEILKIEELKNLKIINWKLNILPRSVCYLQQICPETTEILDNAVTTKK